MLSSLSIKEDMITQKHETMWTKMTKIKQKKLNLSIATPTFKYSFKYFEIVLRSFTIFMILMSFTILIRR